MSAMERVPASQFAQWVKFVAAVLLIPAMGYVVLLERRLTSIEANRFTSKDGLEIMQLINSKADRNEVPPPEVIQRFEHVEAELSEIKDMLREHTREQHGG